MKQRGRWAGMRHYAYANVTAEEYAVIRRFAERDGQTIADFVRSCINDRIAEEDESLAWVAQPAEAPTSEKPLGKARR